MVIERPRETPPRVALIGATGFVGSAFTKELTSRGYKVLAIGRRNCDVYDAQSLLSCLRDAAVEFLINCAGYTGKPNVDACESDKEACLAANAVLPGIIASACETLDLPWGHVSSGCIHTGAFRSCLYGEPFESTASIASVGFTLLVLVTGVFFFTRLQGRFADVI